MAYALTENDINTLTKLGFDMSGVMVGEDAAPSEIEALQGMITSRNAPDQVSRSGMDLSAPAMTGGGAIIPSPQPNATAPAATSPSDFNVYSALRDIGIDPAAADTAQGAIAGTPQVDMSPLTGGMLNIADMSPAKDVQPSASPLMSLLATPQLPQDDLQGLSKNQRMMLAFSAIADLGASMQGKSGDTFANTMKTIMDMKDMERKRQIQTAELQARQQVLGAMGATPILPTDTPEQIDAKIQQLTSILATNPSLAPYVTQAITNANAQRDRAAQAQSQLISTEMGIAAADALISSDKLNEIAGFNGTFNEWANKFGRAPEYATLMGYVNQIQGLNFLEAYQQLKGGGAITELEGKAAAASRSRLEAALKGTPEDLRLAVMDVKNLFEDARSKNPAYKKSGDISESHKRWLEKKE